MLKLAVITYTMLYSSALLAKQIVRFGQDLHLYKHVLLLVFTNAWMSNFT